jgi:hypothetical protein
MGLNEWFFLFLFWRLNRYRRWCDSRGSDISLLDKFFDGFPLFPLEVCLDVFGLIDGSLYRGSRPSGMLTLSVFSTTSVLLRSILCERIELLFSPSSSVD